MSHHSIALVAVAFAIGLPIAQGGEAVQVSVENHERTTIYHSPQTPGFTSWCGLWKMPDGSVMLCFTQATGPVEGWRPKAPADVRKRLGWPPAGMEGYDMTGLILENVHLRSADGGETWDHVSADPFTTCMNGCTGEGEDALADGTILCAVWGQYLPYWDVPQTGYIQHRRRHYILFSADLHQLPMNQHPLTGTGRRTFAAKWGY